MMRKRIAAVAVGSIALLGLSGGVAQANLLNNILALVGLNLGVAADVCATATVPIAAGATVTVAVGDITKTIDPGVTGLANVRVCVPAGVGASVRLRAATVENGVLVVRGTVTAAANTTGTTAAVTVEVSPVLDVLGGTGATVRLSVPLRANVTTNIAIFVG